MKKDIRTKKLNQCVSLGDLMYHIEECKELDRQERSCKTCHYGETIINPNNFHPTIRCSIKSNILDDFCLSYRNKEDEFLTEEEMEIQ